VRRGPACEFAPSLRGFSFAKGSAALFASPALSERCHRSIACRFVAVRRRAVFAIVKKARRTQRQGFAFNLSVKRRLCTAVGKRFMGGVARCCAVSAARSRAAATTNLARSSQSLVLSALFFCAAAKSWATAKVFMICPQYRLVA